MKYNIFRFPILTIIDFATVLLIFVRSSFATTLPQIVTACKTSSYVCDPDQILTTTQVDQLNNALRDIADNTQCPCSSQVCSGSASPRGYRIGIALVNSMQPDVNVTAGVSNPVSDEQAQKLNSLLQTSKLYSSTLVSSWPLNRCGDNAVIFYSLNDSVYYTATGDAISSLLTPDVVGEIAANARMSFTTNIVDGFKNLTANYKLVLLGRYVRTTKLQRPNNDPKTSKVTNRATTLCPASLIVVLCSVLLSLLE